MSLAEPFPDTVYLFCYTSGTTGDPKGVMLSNKNIIAPAVIASKNLDDISNNDITISYLPLAHSFEQDVFTLCLIYGVKIGYYSGDVLKLVDDLQVLKPTFFPSVPRLFNRIYGKV